jgi:hypothetical protein
VSIAGLGYGAPVPAEAEQARQRVQDAVDAYQADWFERFAEEKQLEIPVDPLWGKPLEAFKDATSGEMMLRFQRPGGPVVLGPLEHYGRPEEFIFRLLDPEHRGAETVGIVELLEDRLYVDEPEEIARLRELGFTEEHLRELSIIEEEEEALDSEQ